MTIDSAWTLGVCTMPTSRHPHFDFDFDSLNSSSDLGSPLHTQLNSSSTYQACHSSCPLVLSSYLPPFSFLSFHTPPSFSSHTIPPFLAPILDPTSPSLSFSFSFPVFLFLFPCLPHPRPFFLLFSQSLSRSRSFAQLD
ncbi:hypothetical protein BDN70DRAFT_654294 [Pholiota conissans]|uniref:Uncharacterized protein n=1 Tax=Pholiota conissans TaxID=109636 RepID=A0A9P5YLH0_9AGAR|nr:hypothetical protein BDN70DRAFT_654294 [Pholiota conissans]